MPPTSFTNCWRIWSSRHAGLQQAARPGRAPSRSADTGRCPPAAARTRRTSTPACPAIFRSCGVRTTIEPCGVSECCAWTGAANGRPVSATSSSSATVDGRRALRRASHGEAVGALGQQRDAGAERHDAEPEPDPVHQRVDDDVQAGRLVLQIEGRQHDVEVLGDPAPDGDLGRRLLLVLPEEPLGRVHLADLRAVLEHGEVRRDHLLLPVVGHLHRVVPHGVVRRRSTCCPGLSSTCSSCLKPVAGKAEEDQHDADVDDVAAVAALVAADQADERREDVGARALLAHARAAPELLHDASPITNPHSAKQMPDDQTRTPSATSAPPTDDRRDHRPQELVAQVGQRGLAPRQQRRRCR